jgi:transposase
VAAPGLLAHVIAAKFADHLPLHRLEAILGGHGVAFSRSTMCGRPAGCADPLRGVYDAMGDRVRRSKVIRTDDTPVRLRDGPRDGATTGRIWVCVGDADNPYTVFDLTAGRGREHPEAFPAGFTGYVRADAYAGYNRVHGGTRHVGCRMHARRNFVDARESDPAKADEALAFVRTLYAVEREVETDGLTGDAVADYRRARASPVLDRFADWLEAEHRTARPKSPLGQAVLYARNGWASLTRYVTDGRLAIGRVEKWRGSLGRTHRLPALSVAGASLARPFPVSTSRSSNRTCRFPASGPHPDLQAFAFVLAARGSEKGCNPNSSYR